ncbi:hypothetical protein OAL09_10270 [Verrucomicrobia bacterium]|nr:hypothetical protein [Verrucomicrobiota bacterium]
MNRSLFPHIIWIFVASISFIVGYKFFPAGDGRSARSAGLEQGELSLADSKSLKGEGKGALNQQGKGAGSEIGGGGSSEKKILSDLEIESLGQKLKESTSPIDRRLAFSKLLQGLTEENALLIRDQIKDFDGGSSEFKEFHYAWGAIGGTDAVMFGVDTVEPDMSPALSGWASSDPQKAIAWFEALDMENDSSFDPLLKDRKMKAEDLRNHLMGGLVQGLADTDPDLAIGFVQDVLDSGNKAAHGMMHAPISAMIRSSSPLEAAQWASQLEEGFVRDQAMSRTADHFARKDFEAAKEWAESVSSNDGAEKVIGPVTRNWASRDPEAAMDWVSSLPEGKAQRSGTWAALNGWAGKDPTAASDYLANMPDSEMRNTAISGFSDRLVWENPQAAMTWANSITSDEMRNDALTRVGRSWARKDPKAASDWADSTPGIPLTIQEEIDNARSKQRKN